MSTATEIRYLKDNLWQRRGYTGSDPGPSTPVGNISATALQALLTAGSTGQIFQLAANTVYSGFEALPAYGLALKSGQKLVGAPDGTTILDGSTLVTSWTLHTAGIWKKAGVLPAPYLGTWNGTTFSNDGGQSEIPYGSTTRPDLAGACYPREQMWRDGAHLTRVMRLQDLTTPVVPGESVALRFYQDFTANVIYVNADPSGHEMRMSTARYLLQAADSSYPNALSNCALTNLTVRRFASKSQLGAVTLAGSGWEISNCTFIGNHAIGLHMANADSARIHHNRLHLNGQLGLGQNSSDNVITEYNEIFGNNTDSYWIADWESGGRKATYSTGSIFRYNKVWGNHGVGVWDDIDNRDAQIYGNDIWDNDADGIRYEISYGAQIYGNWITGNGLRFPYGLRVPDSPYSLLAVAGVNVNSSPNVKVHDNMMSPDPQRMVATSLFPATAVHIRGNQNGVSAQMRNRGNGGFGPRDLNNFESYNNDVTLTGYFLPEIAAQGKTPTTTGSEFGATVNGIRTLSVDVALYNGPTKNNRFYNNTYRLDATTKNRFSWNNTYIRLTDSVNGTGVIERSAAAGWPQEVGSTVTGAPRPGLRVTASGDDGTWTSVGTTAFSSSTSANLIGDFDGTNFGHCAWIRITNVPIPQGATIDTAYLELLAKGQNGGEPPMLIRAHNAGDSTAPTTRAGIDARTRTSAQTEWAPTDWPVATWLNTPSVVGVLQEIVNRLDWVPGNAVTFLIEPQTLGFSVQQLVSFTAYDDPSKSSAGLIYTYH